MKPHPEVIELDYDDLQSKLDQIEAVMGLQMVQPFRQLLHWYTMLLGLLRDKTISIKRLRKMRFTDNATGRRWCVSRASLRWEGWFITLSGFAVTCAGRS